MFECPRHEAIRVGFLVDKNTGEALDKADWRKVGESEDAWYFEAVEEFFGRLCRGVAVIGAGSRGRPTAKSVPEAGA